MKRPDSKILGKYITRSVTKELNTRDIKINCLFQRYITCVIMTHYVCLIVIITIINKSGLLFKSLLLPSLRG